MLVSRKHNFFFIHICKNAGTSITRALMPYAAGTLAQKSADLVKKLGIVLPYDPRPFAHHITAAEVIERIGRPAFDAYFSFAIVRNPWDWQVSLYSYIRKTRRHRHHQLVNELGSFDRYVRWRCAAEVRLQREFIYSPAGDLLVDFVGRYENLDADFARICDHIGIQVTLPVLNVSNKKPYQAFYTAETRDLVGMTYRADVETFDYAF